MVEFEVRASHRFGGRSGLVCEIYPDVSVGQRGIVASRYAGMAMQQPGDIVDALPAGEQQWLGSARGYSLGVHGGRDPRLLVYQGVVVCAQQKQVVVSIDFRGV